MPDPKEGEPGWKDITEQCKPLVKEFLAKATELFGQPTTAGIPIRVTDFSEGPRTCFHNGIAYIRIPPGVSSDKPVLKRQLAHEVVHVLSGDAPNTVLEEGLASYFAVHYGDEYAPHAEDPNEQKYYEAYTAVRELLERCPTIIKDLREPARSIDKISAGEIRELCPDYPGDFNRLVSKYLTT